jgi:hypothetical protein
MLTGRGAVRGRIRQGGRSEHRSGKMASIQDVKPMRSERSTEELRAAMYRILDELASARSDRTTDLKKEFDELWKGISGGRGEPPTVH